MNEVLKRPENFSYFGENASLFKDWSLGPIIESKQSNTLERSNSHTIQSILNEAENNNEIESDHWKIERCSHWACGWVDHLSFKVRDENGMPTKTFNKVMELMRRLEEYPILDEDDFYGKLNDELIEYIKENFCVNKNAPTDWYEQVINNLSIVDLEDLNTEEVNRFISSKGWTEED